MRIKFLVLVLTTLWVGTQVVADDHPLSNVKRGNKDSGWEIEFDEDFRDKDNHGMRLVVPPIENPATKPILTDPFDGAFPVPANFNCWLYRFKDFDSVKKHYKLKDLKDGGAVQLKQGFIQWAPTKTKVDPADGKTYTFFLKARLQFVLTGEYDAGSGNMRQVTVKGCIHTGHDNHAKHPSSGKNRNDYRVVFVVNDIPKPPGLDRLLEALRKSDGYSIEPKLMQELLALLFTGVDCNEVPPACSEGTFSAPEIFDYDPLHL